MPGQAPGFLPSGLWYETQSATPFAGCALSVGAMSWRRAWKPLPVEPQNIPLTAEDVLVLRWFRQLEGADRATALRFISALALTRAARFCSKPSRPVGHLKAVRMGRGP